MSFSRSRRARRAFQALGSASLVVAVQVVPVGRPATSVAAGAVQTPELPRSETLYTSGTSSAPPTNFNPLEPTLAYTGTQGLLYEPLFLYDPIKARFIDWLATSGGWVGAGTFRLVVRPGVDWVKSPGGEVVGKLTGTDVVSSIDLARDSVTDPYHSDVKDIKAVSSDGPTVTVTFSQPVNYAAWQDYLWHAPVLPHGQWVAAPGTKAAAPGTTAATGPSSANLSPVSSGPMLLYRTTPTEACYQDNPHWWGWAALNLKFSFTYLCDVVSGPSGQELSDLLDDRVDWSNALLRGVPDLVGVSGRGYGLKTYYSRAPYMLAASTAWLEMNASKEPMSDLDFRRSVASAVDPSAVVASAYTGAVATAGPTGLLPNLAPYIDKDVVKKDAHGYSPSRAKKLLAKSGYKGQLLSIEVPSGEPDLAAAADLISKQLRSVGIKVVARVVSREQRSADMQDGRYDMVIDDMAGLSSSPWAYFDRVFALPVKAQQASMLNVERFSDPAAWALVQQAASTPPGDTKQLQSIYDQLEADFLEEVPEVPVWYGGAWFQASTAYWENYPSSTSASDRYTPVMWPGWLGSTTTVFALAALKHHRKGT